MTPPKQRRDKFRRIESITEQTRSGFGFDYGTWQKHERRHGRFDVKVPDHGSGIFHRHSPGRRQLPKASRHGHQGTLPALRLVAQVVDPRGPMGRHGRGEPIGRVRSSVLTAGFFHLARPEIPPFHQVSAESPGLDAGVLLSAAGRTPCCRARSTHPVLAIGQTNPYIVITTGSDATGVSG